MHAVRDTIDLLRSARIAIIGYGSQGRAHALNLRDSGYTVVVGARPGSSWNRAEQDGFPVVPVAGAAASGDLLALLLPDEEQQDVYRTAIAPSLDAGKALLFAHGFAVHYGEIVPPAEVDVLLVAPIGPGRTVRELYTRGQGVPAVVAVHQDPSGHAHTLAREYAAGIGSTRAGIVRSTFAEETETDLFGEQAVLCGGIPFLMKAGFDTLVDAGYQPELAFFECIHQVKLIVDMIDHAGFEGMYAHISNTAEFGALRAGPAVTGEHAREAMRQILTSIRDGNFARQWSASYHRGVTPLTREATAQFGAIDTLGEELRRSMKLDESD